MLLKLWNRISTQLYISFAGAVVLVILISLLALFFLSHIGKVQQIVNEKNIPEMTSAFAIAQQTSMLVAAAPRLTASTPEQFKEVAVKIDQQTQRFETQLLAMMEEQGGSEQTRQIESDGILIIQNIERIKLLVRERFELQERNRDLRREFQELQSKVEAIVIEKIDDQMFYMMTGYRSLEEDKSARSVHFSETEFTIYRRLSELREAATVAERLLADAFIVSDVAMLEPLRERFETTAGRIIRSLDAIEQYEQKGNQPLRSTDSALSDVLKNRKLHDQNSLIFEDLISFGRRDGNGFDLRSREFAIDNELSSLLSENQALSIDIVAQVKSVVNDSSVAAGEMASKATSVTATSVKLLLVVNIISISGAILFGWLLVQRRLIRRLERISNQMQQMADGDLELDIDIKGNDEIAQLAKALDVFRNNALEVQRLNLVETLAGELQEKNEELKRMQEQIVMQEKLAALGELTAGVAHEIKNPINFIINFSDVSQELLEELLEEVAKNKDKGEYNPKLVDEVAQDLVGNLKRIYEHGNRANRIITDMLKMGRGGEGEWKPTDLNVLLSENALLAFHSARAANSEFQLEIQEDYTPDIGEITVQPQDMGRVFLNLVTNACYATNKKQKMLLAAPDVSNKDYQPTLKLSTRLIDDCIEVHVRDNGTGIPESALERIFHPFYTTKPPDEGTGLGLSLSNDIIRQHGGKFRVETREGEYADMIIVLPLDPAESLSIS